MTDKDIELLGEGNEALTGQFPDDELDKGMREQEKEEDEYDPTSNLNLELLAEK